AGAEPSGSERDISVGGVARVPVDVFAGVDYTALGHLHGPHTLTDTIRYSGSPLAYSFSEAGHRKGAWLVELGAGGLAHAEFVDAPVPRPLARLRGSLEELLQDPAHAVHEGSWVEATLTDRVRPTQAMDRLRRRFPHALLLSFDTGLPVTGLAPVTPSTVRTDHDIASDFMADMRGTPPDDHETALLFRAIDACCADPDVDTLVSEEVPS
ncbi:MAG TPA: exonuclease SbcCD subunit D C-terminal domain-containing protein, partial [Nocardioides sp.]|nr:exonuclease SbcCD subunit D C-terminal domain-containing protein [Nocardioides sp.]